MFTADGVKFGAEFLVNTITTGYQSAPTITALADGRFVVAWSDGSHVGGDPYSSAIHAQIFDAGEPPRYHPTSADLEYIAKVTAYDFTSVVTADTLLATQYLPLGYAVQPVFQSGTFVALALTSDNGDPILAFRGTLPLGGPAGWEQDWRANGNLTAVGYGEINPFRAQLLDWLRANPEAHITGHSQGGAQAQMIAAWATEAGIQIGNLVTFNSPGIDADDAARFVASKAGNVLHNIVQGDVVSMVGDRYVQGNVNYYDFDASYDRKLVTL